MEKLVKIGDKDIKMVSNAFTPIKFKSIFKEDIIVGLSKINENNLEVDVLSKLAYCMALQADPNIESLEDWLCQFEFIDLYKAMPDIIGLWVDNNVQTSKPKKPQGK